MAVSCTGFHPPLQCVLSSRQRGWSRTARAAVVTGKKSVYVEPSRRVKELLEEELYIQKEACYVKHPVTEALEGIWNMKKNFSIGRLNPVPQNRNSLLLQPRFYSRHTGMKNC